MTNPRQFLTVTLFLIYTLLFAACGNQNQVQSNTKSSSTPEKSQEVHKSIEVLLDRASKQIKRKKYKQATETYRKVLESDSSNRQAWTGISKVALRMDNPKAALPFAQEAVRRHPEKPEAINFLGVVYVSIGDYSSAKKMFDRGLEVDPEDPTLLVNTMHWAEEQEKWKLVRKYANRLKEVWTDSALPWINVAKSQLKLGNIQKAINELKEGIKKEPGNGRPHYHLGFIYDRYKHPKLSKRHFKSALSKELPDHYRKDIKNFMKKTDS